ncbi:multifunctional CCA addition/repair protein [Thalassotalea insulae]|uniref:multifunctional CCA addition/repair protein n=1 Tax=Thalassotalea insulae TaxID=2056778 RepID=UPI003D674719
MNAYLVGGAVRDQLLSRTVVERDYVVVGSNVQQMLALGFSQVGKDFPVFLHPTTKEEYALARTEKKQGQGYTGFTCYSSPEVTLEQDLLRRDLTVNAMALDNQGNIIDPFNGQQDLRDRILRHVSPAFVEDPLRVLRVARFAARYHYLGFTVADETMALMSQISNNGELITLSGERVWKEIANALTEQNPEIFFQLLHQCSALNTIWPELDNLWQEESTTSNFANLAEVALANLTQAVKLTDKTDIRFASLCLAIPGLNLAASPQDITELASRLKLPKQTQLLALKATQLHSLVTDIKQQTPQAILSLFDQLDVWRKNEFFDDFLLVCQATAQAIENAPDQNFTAKDYLKTLLKQCKTISAQAFIAQGLTGKAIKSAMQAEKLNIITNYPFPDD